MWLAECKAIEVLLGETHHWHRMFLCCSHNTRQEGTDQGGGVHGDKEKRQQTLWKVRDEATDVFFLGGHCQDDTETTAVPQALSFVKKLEGRKY